MSIFSGLFGGGGGAAVKKGMGYTDQGVNQAAQMFRMFQDAFHQAEASGQYNPDQQMQTTKKQLEHSFNIGSGNLAAKQGGFGYKTGDSNLAQSQRNLSAGANLQAEQAMLQIKRMFEDAHNQGRMAVAGAGNNYANALSGAGQQYMGYGQQQQSTDNNIFGQLFSAIPSFGKK
jgi:hypothetical protein